MSRYKKSGKKSTSHSLADVTINDFANSSVCKNRIKKATANVNNVLKQQLEVDDKSWDEKNEEYDGEFIETVNEDGTISYTIQKPIIEATTTTTRRRRKNCSISEQSTTAGNEYPIDIWFLISEYIHPEDVGRFAGICKASYEVVCTAKFWFSLYKRYYKSPNNLPERLQPECLLRKYGLRTSVIRALYFMYEPFINHYKSFERIDQHPDVLKQMQCISMWTHQIRKDCVYFFKLKFNNKQPNQHQFRMKQKPDLLEMLDDIYANQDDGCRILQVTCKYLIPMVPVLGLTLKTAQLNLSSELRYHKLQLWFGSEIQCLKSPPIGGNGGSSDNILIVLEPVINVKILDWWHPLYPHRYNIEHLFNQE